MKTQSGGTTSEHEQRRADRCSGGRRGTRSSNAPRSQSRVCSVSRTSRAGAESAAKPVLRRLRDAEVARPARGFVTAPRSSGASVAAERDDARREARLRR